MGQVEFYLNEHRASSSMLLPLHHKEHFPFASQVEKIIVPVLTLDSVMVSHISEQPDLIKIDVQGFEDRVIRGGFNTLRNTRWCLVEVSLVELYQGAPTFDTVYQLLSDLGFELREITDQWTGTLDIQVQLNVLFENSQGVGQAISME